MIIHSDTNQAIIIRSETNKAIIIPSPGLHPVAVKEVLEFDSVNDFPQEGQSETLYIDTNSNIMYRWDGLSYVSFGASSVSGSLFVTDVTNNGSGIVGNKAYLPNTTPANAVLTSAQSDDDSVTIHFIAEGTINYSPIVTLDGVPCSNMTEIPGQKRMFTGSFDVTVPVSTTFVLTHSDGNTAEVTIDRAADGPSILSVNFTNGYPAGQTEVKEGDTFDVEIHFDPNGSEPVSVFVDDYGAAEAGVFDLSGTELDWGNVHKATITVTIRATGTSPTFQSCRLHAINSFGTAGNTVDSNQSGGGVDGVDVVLCNDIIPSFGTPTITYPPTQQAFKGVESGSVSITVSDFTDVVYTSPTNEFVITDDTVYGVNKTITCTNPGTYNDSTPNYTITATRTTNGTSTQISIIIEVADTAPTITVTQPQPRLRTALPYRDYVITATSDQNLPAPPDLTVGVSGTWLGASFVGGPKVWTRSIRIDDNDSKGIGAWGFATVPTNNAGIPAVITGDQNVGGFEPRTLTVDAWPVRSTAIGTDVVDTAKLVCENLSKGGNGPNGGTFFLYQASTNDAVDRFTIVGNDYWYNCDLANAVSNTTGTAQVILEETV